MKKDLTLKMLTFDPLAVKSCFIHQTKAFSPKIEILSCFLMYMLLSCQNDRKTYKILKQFFGHYWGITKNQDHFHMCAKRGPQGVNMGGQLGFGLINRKGKMAKNQKNREKQCLWLYHWGFQISLKEDDFCKGSKVFFLFSFHLHPVVDKLSTYWP